MKIPVPALPRAAHLTVLLLVAVPAPICVNPAHAENPNAPAIQHVDITVTRTASRHQNVDLWQAPFGYTISVDPWTVRVRRAPRKGFTSELSWSCAGCDSFVIEFVNDKYFDKSDPHRSLKWTKGSAPARSGKLSANLKDSDDGHKFYKIIVYPPLPPGSYLRDPNYLIIDPVYIVED